MFMVPMTRNASDLVRSFERLFGDSFDRPLAPAPRGALAQAPAVDVAESERAYTVTMDLPGVTKDDVRIAIDGRQVSIEARSQREEDKKEGDRTIYRERAETSYARRFAMPAEIDESGSNAKLDNGVLTLTLAKRVAPASRLLTVN